MDKITDSIVSNWHGVNLLGMFRWQPEGDSRAPGYFSEESFRWLEGWGFNFARLPMDYRHFLDSEDWRVVKEDGFKKVDDAVAYGRKHGIHVQLCLHHAPGFIIADWLKSTDKKLQTDPEPQEAFLRIWSEFARRYRGISNLGLSFNPVNEPSGFSEEQFIDLFGRTIEAIRLEDPERFVMLDGNHVASVPVAHFFGVPLTGQAFRGYTPHAISHYGAWYIKDQPKTEPVWPCEPGEGDNPASWIWENPGKTVEKWVSVIPDGYPRMIGEFGCFNKIRHETALRWMEFCLQLWHQHDVGWAIWNLDGAFGFLDSGRTDIEYEDFEGHKLDRKMLDLLQKYSRK